MCIGLSEIMKFISWDVVLYFFEFFVFMVRKVLCDLLEEVREVVVKIFE